MSLCINCAKDIGNAKFCPFCGAENLISSGENRKKSTILKYADYANDEAIYRVAAAKKQGLVKLDYPEEVEDIVAMLAERGYANAMFDYAQILLSKFPPKTETAYYLIKSAAKRNHAQSLQYLEIYGKRIFPEFANDIEKFERDRKEQEWLKDRTIKTNVIERNTPVLRNLQRDGGVLSGVEIYERMSYSMLEVISEDGKFTSSASGFFITSTGFVITNAHAVMDKRNHYYDNVNIIYQGRCYGAMVLAVGAPIDGKNNSIDIALLYVDRIASEAIEPAIVGGNEVKAGQKVYVIGNSMGEGLCITSGILSDTKRNMPGLLYDYYMTDAAVNSGNSGGPMLDEEGRVIGVIVAGHKDAEGMNYAIPMDIVMGFATVALYDSNLSDSLLGEMTGWVNNQTRVSALMADEAFDNISLFKETLSKLRRK